MIICGKMTAPKSSAKTVPGVTAKRVENARSTTRNDCERLRPQLLITLAEASGANPIAPAIDAVT